jgi:hypothetical protein
MHRLSADWEDIETPHLIFLHIRLPERIDLYL